jgi:methylmalonyl-CoA mutase cobalamin-binding subunit
MWTSHHICLHTHYHHHHAPAQALPRRLALHVADDRVGVLCCCGAAAEILGAVLAVRDRLEARGLDHVCLVDHVEVAQHHDAGEEQRGGVGEVLALRTRHERVTSGDAYDMATCSPYKRC